MRNLTPFYNVRNKESFAHLPKGMKLLEAKIDNQKEAVPGWFLKIGETLDLNALVHDDYLVQQGSIPSDDVIIPSSLALRGLLFVLKEGNKSIYFQTPLPSPVACGRSTEQNADAEFLYGLNFSSAIGAQPHNPDAYYQVSLVFDTRTGKIASGSKVKLVSKDVKGELSIIGYLLSGKIDVPVVAEVESTAEEGFIAGDVHGEFAALMKLREKVDLSSQLPPVMDQGELGSSTACAIVAANEVVPTSRDAGFLYANERIIDSATIESDGAIDPEVSSS